MREQFVDEDSFVNEIDRKIAAAQLAFLIGKIVGGTNNRANTLADEIISQQHKFIRGGQILPVDDGNIRQTGTAPFAVRREQRFEQFLHAKAVCERLA